MEGKYTGIRYVHSEAEIEAKVWHEFSTSMMYEQIEEIKTGNSEKRYFLGINNFKINLYKSLPNFKKYDTIDKTKQLKMFSDFYLPIELGIYEYQEINSIKRVYTYEELRKMIVTELEEQASEQIEDLSNVVNTQINEREIDGGLEIQIIYEVLEKIGIEEKIEN